MQWNYRFMWCLVLAGSLAQAGCGGGGSGGADAHVVDAAGTKHDASPGADATLPVDAASDAADGGADASADATTDASVHRAFAIAFRGVVGQQTAECGAVYGGFGPTEAQSASIRDFRLYVHAIELIRQDATSEPLVLDEEAPWQHDGVAMLDFEDHTGACSNGTDATRTVVRGSAPDDAYVGIRFVLGVPFSQNHQDRSSAAAPLDLSPLFWSWQGGYIFNRLDLVTEAEPDGGTVSGFSVHLGSTGCDGSPASGGTTACSAPNRPTITLDGFDPDAAVVLVDALALVAGVDLTVNTPATAVGCMSSPVDPECVSIMPRLGVDFGVTPGAQTYFRVGAP